MAVRGAPVVWVLLTQGVGHGRKQQEASAEWGVKAAGCVRVEEDDAVS